MNYQLARERSDFRSGAVAFLVGALLVTALIGATAYVQAGFSLSTSGGIALLSAGLMVVGFAWLRARLRARKRRAAFSAFADRAMAEEVRWRRRSDEAHRPLRQRQRHTKAPTPVRSPVRTPVVRPRRRRAVAIQP